MNTVTAILRITNVKNCKNFMVNYRIQKFADCVTSFLPGGYILQTYSDQYGRPCYAYTTLKMKKDVEAVRFPSVERRDEYVTKRIAALAKWELKKVEDKAAAKVNRAAAIAALVEGEILYTSWGYEQTNTEFYQIVSVKGSRVEAREIQRNYETTGWEQGLVRPIINRFLNEKKIRVTVHGGGHFSIDGHGAWKHETGKKHSVSSYH